MSERGKMLATRLRNGELLFATFLCLPCFETAEVLAGAGFDCVVIDAEHAPTAPARVHLQLAALASGQTAAIVRLPDNDPVQIKYYLDLGTDALMVPNVASAEQARAAVAATRYPPEGLRGVGGSMRASRHGRDKSYSGRANSEICLILQIESEEGLASLPAIMAVPGVDAVFFGPNDYAASIGLLGEPAHPRVLADMEAGVRAARAAGMACGILVGEAFVDRFIAAGAHLLAVGSEIGLLVQAADGLAARLDQKRRAPNT